MNSHQRRVLRRRIIRLKQERTAHRADYTIPLYQGIFGGTLRRQGHSYYWTPTP